jgi:SAM-dependent methyltransferase
MLPPFEAARRSPVKLRNIIRQGRVQLARIRDPESFKRHAMVGPAQHWRSKRKFQITFLQSNGLKPTDMFLDVGCGTLRGGIPIIDHLEPGSYTGLDVRDEVLAEAREELKQSGLEHKRPKLFNSSDFDAIPTDDLYDKAWAFAVLIHMADDISERAFKWIGAHMKPGGVFFADVKIGERVDAAQNKRQFPVVTRPYEFYEERARTGGFTKVEDLGTNLELGHRTGMQGDKRHMLKFTR